MTATLLGATACGSSDAPSTPADEGTPTKVTVGVIPIVDVAPIYLGKEKGFFSSRGIDLTMESGQGGAAIVPGVLSGQFQFGFSNMTSLMVAQTQNVPIKVVVNGVASTGKQGADFGGVTVKGDSPIQSAKDLAGKKVAVNTLKNIGDTTVRESVRKAGGDPSTISFVEIGFPQMPAALAAGQVDAAWVVEPSLSVIKAQGGRVVAWNYADAAPNLTVATYFTSNKLLQEDPDLVKRFAEAMNESLAYASAHEDEVRQVLGTYTQIDQKTRDAMTLPEWPTEINRASIETLATLGKNDGVFGDKTPDLGQLLP
ncbi:ABC transporter substrate-binding protein [Phytohabitans suffuscus]|uniref:ABC transporter substrate-binding protein n=1 Tax=Phytohabitans suffuscus TaxID=624315 RepID=UPI001E4A3F24|nr:ABC transporter substrate-binding protein [Phytohabitans suffuscus]